MELDDKLYQHIKKVTLGMAVNLKILDTEEALSEMHEVIAKAFTNFDKNKMPSEKDALEKYIILCVKRRLINYILKTQKEQLQLTNIEPYIPKLTNIVDDPTLMTRFNLCVNFVKTKLDNYQKKIFMRMLIGENTSEISKSMKIDRVIVARERKYILSLIKENL